MTSGLIKAADISTGQMEWLAEGSSAVFVLWVPMFRAIEARWQMISIWIVRYRRVDPASSIDLIKQHLEGIIGGDGDLHRLSRPSVCAIEQLAYCRNPSCLALRFQRQASKLDNNRRSMLARQFLHLAENFGAPTRIATLALAKFQILLFLCFPPVLRHIRDPGFVFKAKTGRRTAYKERSKTSENVLALPTVRSTLTRESYRCKDCS
jgi:hypothetical protein